MNQRKLYRTIENIASKDFENIEDLLKNLVNEVIQKEDFRFTGGRIWKISPNKKTYRLIFQTGDIDKIEEGFSLRVSDNPIFHQVSKQRALAASETDKYLRKKGIVKYSLAGVGDKIFTDSGPLFPYLLAFNILPEDVEGSIYTLNIISSAVTNVLRRNVAEQKTKMMEKDLDAARAIQKSILPEHSLRFGNYEIFGLSVAEQIVGGDFFDYIESDEEHDRITVVIGDAASKGLSAAIQALYVSGAIRMGMNFQIKISALLKKLNNLVNRTFPDDRFVTLFITDLIDSKTGLCVFSNAGHNNPIFYNKSRNIIKLLNVTGPALGLSPNQVYGIENVNLDLGDILLLYTDGITEAMNSDYELYGEERLEKRLIGITDHCSKDICHLILEDVMNFSQRTPYSDDKTLVAIKRIK